MATEKDTPYKEYLYKNSYSNTNPLFPFAGLVDAMRGNKPGAPAKNPAYKDSGNWFTEGNIWNWDPNIKYAESRPASDAQGVSGWLQGMENWSRDMARSGSNFAGDVWNWLGSRENAKPGQGFGDYLYGATPGTYSFTDNNAALAGPSPARAQAQAADMRAAKAGASEAPAQQDAYDVLMGYMGNMASTNDARLKAMYQQVADYITGLTPETKQVYTDAASGYTGANKAATQAVNAGFGTARDQLSRSLKALGIEDAALNIMASGQDMSQNQSAITSNLGRILGSNLNRNTAAQTGALQNLLDLAKATQGEGARARTAYGENMQGQILNILKQQQESQMSAEQRAAELAAKSSGQPSATAAEASQLYNTFYQEAIDRKLTTAEAQKEAQAKVNIWLAANGL